MNEWLMKIMNEQFDEDEEWIIDEDDYWTIWWNDELRIWLRWWMT